MPYDVVGGVTDGVAVPYSFPVLPPSSSSSTTEGSKGDLLVNPAEGAEKIGAEEGERKTISERLYVTLRGESVFDGRFLAPLSVPFNSPKEFLNNNFSKFLGLGGRDLGSYQVESIGKGKPWFTATFICPITGETYSSGTLRDIGRYDFDSKEIKGKLYYTTLSAAEATAAARAIDCLSLWHYKQGVNETKKYELSDGVREDTMRLCVEEPYLSQAHKAAIKDRIEATLLHNHSRDFNKRYLCTQNISSNYIEITENSATTRWWTATFIYPPSGEKFDCGSKNSEPVRVENGKVFYRKKINAEYAAAARAFDCLSFRKREKLSEDGEVDEAGGIDGAVRLCTEKPYSSLDHASGMSDDQFHETPLVTSIPDSNPVLGVPLALEEEEEEYEEYIVQNLLVSGDQFFREYKADSAYGLAGGSNVLACTTIERILDAWSDVPSSDVNALTSAEPRPFGVQAETATMDHMRAALAWYQLIGGVDREKSVSQALPKSNPMSVSACNAVLNALGNANMFAAASGRQLEINLCDFFGDHDVPISGGGQEVALGAVERLASQIMDRMLLQQAGVPDDDNVLQHDFSCRQNTHTLNCYIRCVSRPSRVETAEVAERLLNDMVDGRTFKGHKLPPPDVETYNTVMELWTNVPGQHKLCHRKVSELYSKLEMLMMAGNTPIRGDGVPQKLLKPNRRTFLTALSALARLTGGSDAGIKEGKELTEVSLSEARVWIKKMERLAERYHDKSLIPDTEIYNAALRWSGGLRKKKLPLERFPFTTNLSSPWDDYASIFKNGLKVLPTDNDEKDLQAEAQDMEKWLLDMEQASLEEGRADLAPDIETYEAVIQAWVRTGTEQGIKRAEGWASRAIDADSIHPRLQTFHPILAAWVHCGEERGPKQVQDWINKLHELGDVAYSENCVRPDGRVQVLPILAWRNYQLAISAGIRDPVHGNLINEQHTDLKGGSSGYIQHFNDELTPSIHSAAKKCTEYLERTCTESSNKDYHNTFLNGTAFMHVVNAWGDAAAVSATWAHQKQKGNAIVSESHALVQMLHAIQLLDTTLDSFRHSFQTQHQKNKADIEEKGGDQPNETALIQIRHLIQVCHGIYANAIFHILKIDDINTKKRTTDDTSESLDFFEETSYFVAHLPKIEMMLRKSAELQNELHQLEELSENYVNDQSGAEASIYISDTLPVAVEPFQYNDSFSYEKVHQASSLGFLEKNLATAVDFHQQISLYTEILNGCKNLSSLTRCGDAVRLTMFILDQINGQTQAEKNISNSVRTSVDLTDLYELIVAVVNKVVLNPYEKKALLNRVTDSALRISESSDSKKIFIARVDSDVIFGAIQNAVKGDNVAHAQSSQWKTKVKPAGKKEG